MKRTAFDLAPLVALLVFWATAGWSGAVTVAEMDGGGRYLWLGWVTLPALGTIGAAMVRVWRERGE